MSWGIHHILDAVIITHIHEHFLKLLTWLEEGFYCLGEEVHLFLLTYMMKRFVLMLDFSFVSFVQTESQVGNPLSCDRFSHHGDERFGTGA